MRGQGEAGSVCGRVLGGTLRAGRALIASGGGAAKRQGCASRWPLALGLTLSPPPKPYPPQVNWGVPNEIDFIAASFVRKGTDLDFVREVLGEKGR